jgi:hypothetical protein
VSTRREDARSSYKGIILSYHESAVLDVPTLENKTSGWQSNQVGQTLSALSLCSWRNKSTRSWTLILTPTLFWGRVSLEISTACSTSLSHESYWKKKPTFIPSDDSVYTFWSLKKNLMLILFSKYLLPIFLTSYLNITLIWTKQLCICCTCQY